MWSDFLQVKQRLNLKRGYLLLDEVELKLECLPLDDVSVRVVVPALRL